MDQRSDFIGYTATELAKQANVSKATATRLFKRLGYRSFEEARQVARQVNHRARRSNNLRRVARRGCSNVLEHLATDQENLRKTFDRITADQMEQSSISCQGTDDLDPGLRNSYGLAHYARFILNMLRECPAYSNWRVKFCRGSAE